VELLLDTHIFLWWQQPNPRLRHEHRDLIEDPSNRIYISAVCVWEIAVKRRLGKLAFEGSLVRTIKASGLFEAPIYLADAEAAGDLDWAHKDPFDRLLVAQAGRLGAALMTVDAEMRTAPAAILWAG